MVKKRVSLSLDEDVLEKAKSEINNLSLFVEDALKFYLGFNSNNRNKDLQIKLLSDEITKKQFKIYLLSRSLLKKDNNERLLLEEKNRGWKRLWNYYYLYRTYDYSRLSDAMDSLDMSEDELVAMMNLLIDYKDEIDIRECDKWEYSIGIYNQLKIGDDG